MILVTSIWNTDEQSLRRSVLAASQRGTLKIQTYVHLFVTNET